MNMNKNCLASRGPPYGEIKKSFVLRNSNVYNMTFKLFVGIYLVLVGIERIHEKIETKRERER